MDDFDFSRIFKVLSASLIAASLNISIAEKTMAANQNSADEAELRAQAASYARAFSAGDLDRLLSFFDEQAIVVDLFGNLSRGKEAIKQQYKEFFARAGKQALEVSVESIKFPTDDTAIEEGYTRLSNSSSDSAMAHYVAVHFKRNGRWYTSTVTESPYRATTNGEYLKPLSWLVGNWKADTARGTMRIKAYWANKNVICLEFSDSALPDSALQTEYIYWNPATHLVSSWQFDSSGGVSRSYWERRADDWLLHADSLQADGALSKALNILHPIDTDSFSWQSKKRQLGNIDLPDTEPVKVVRVKG
ncbi:MAG: SgcJ/EcaC family oxidoreductase [Candidatus Obscuribacterales bacterium]|nr:SgcJ/EcaC family oxidoreductase [Candidatus Obscuribacterales bacterium]